jgi:hypothetical protein
VNPNRSLQRILLTISFIFLVTSYSASAQQENHIGIVIDFGDGVVETRCVSFTEKDISGFEALMRSNLAVELNTQSGGQAICRVNETGCPANDCFCACRGGGDCLYWSYWHLAGEEWEYSVAGSGLYRVTDGMVEGWRWGPGSITEAIPPPDYSFEAICSSVELAQLDLPLTEGKDQGSEQTNIELFLSVGGILFLLGILAWFGTSRRNRSRGSG